MFKRHLALFLAGMFYVATTLHAATVDKLFWNDLWWATGGSGAAETYTSPANRTGTRIDASHIKFRSVAGSPDNLVDGSYSLTPKVADVITRGPWVDVRAYGAVGDGTTDDTAAIQAAIDNVKGIVGSGGGSPITQTRAVFFPNGNYGISSRLKEYSGIPLVGNGPGSRITTLAGFTDNAIVSLESIGGYCSEFTIANLSFVSTVAGVAAIRQNATTITNGRIKNVWMYLSDGIVLDSYAQGMMIDGVLAGGSYTNKVLHLRGNFNNIKNIDKEGTTGSSTDPYLYIWGNTDNSDSSGNYLENILIEGGTSANKTPAKFDNVTNLTINGFWIEPTSTDGYSVRITDSEDVFFRGTLVGITTTAKHKISTSRVHYEKFGISGEDSALGNYLELDALSNVSVDTLSTRRGADAYMIDNVTKNSFVAKRVVNTLPITTPDAGYSPVNHPRYDQYHNLFVNPSFEAGVYGWTMTAADNTAEYVASEVGPGLMAHYKWNSATAPTIYQTFNAPAAWVGRPMTVSALVKATGKATALVSMLIDGAGITATNGYPRAYGDTGWQLLTQTFYPQSADATFNVGIWGAVFDNTVDLYVDEMSLSFGLYGHPNSNYFGSLELNGKSMTYGAAAPTTGTWKVGDIVFNNAADNVVLWKCTVAGTPGTWSSLSLP